MAFGFDPHHDPDDLLTDVSERPSRLQRLLDASLRRLRSFRRPSLPWTEGHVARRVRQRLQKMTLQLP